MFEQIKEWLEVRRWVKHIIKKFGTINAENWARSKETCPCRFLKWFCEPCGYKRILPDHRYVTPCREALMWFFVYWEIRMKIKSKILKKLYGG